MQYTTTPSLPADALSEELWRFGLRHPTALCVLTHLMVQKLAFAQVLDVPQIALTLDVSALNVHRAIRFLRQQRYVNVVQHKNRQVYIVIAWPITPAPQIPGVPQRAGSSAL